MIKRNLLKKEAEHLLGHAGLKRTPGRVEMLSVLLNAHEPLTQQEILDRVSETGFNRVSVYRSLHAFTEAGLVHRVEAGDRLWRFAICHCGSRIHCHPHFTCRVCGKVECLSNVSLPQLKEPLPGYRVEEQEVYLKGTCAGCRAPESAS